MAQDIISKSVKSVKSVDNNSKGLPRSFEVVVSLVGLVLMFPLMAISAAMIALTSRGGIMFRQKRVGRHGETFVLYKLRTMKVANAGPQVTSKNDTRITKVSGMFSRVIWPSWVHGRKSRAT